MNEKNCTICSIIFDKKCIPESFTTKKNFVNSQRENTNSKVYFHHSESYLVWRS